MHTWTKVRRMLGVHDALLVVAFLAANSVVDVTLNLLDHPAAQVMWLGALTAATVALAFRQARRANRSERTGTLDGSDFGVYADGCLPARRGAVVVCGLDSGTGEGALARLLCEAENLEYLAIIGTHETRELGIDDTIRKRLLPICGTNIDASHFRVWDHNHALSVGDFAESVSEALTWLNRCGLHPDEIIVDVSAGRRMAGFGALQAADAAGVETQYLAHRWDHEAHRPILDEVAFRVVSIYRTDRGPHVPADTTANDQVPA